MAARVSSGSIDVRLLGVYEDDDYDGIDALVAENKRCGLTCNRSTHQDVTRHVCPDCIRKLQCRG